jgi:hypothetical protein
MKPHLVVPEARETHPREATKQRRLTLSRCKIEMTYHITIYGIKSDIGVKTLGQKMGGPSQLGEA